MTAILRSGVRKQNPVRVIFPRLGRKETLGHLIPEKEASGGEEVGGISCRKRPQLLKGMLNVKTSNRGSTTLPLAIPTSVPLSLFDHHRLSPHNAETSHGDELANYHQILRTSKGFWCIMGRRDLDVCQFNLVYVS